MAGHVYRKTEVIGTSQASMEDAVNAAIGRAAQTLKGLEWFEVKEVRGTIRDGRVNEYQVTVSIGFRVMTEDELRA
jgi:flavin-binding protein dodecin